MLNALCCGRACVEEPGAAAHLLSAPPSEHDLGLGGGSREHTPPPPAAAAAGARHDDDLGRQESFNTVVATMRAGSPFFKAQLSNSSRSLGSGSGIELKPQPPNPLLGAYHLADNRAAKPPSTTFPGGAVRRGGASPPNQSATSF